MTRPFRWDVSRREQLGSLVAGEPEPLNAWFLEQLRDCLTRVIALAGDSELVFVGRSPESLFDYLSGLLADGSWAERPRLLNISIRQTPEQLARTRPAALAAAHRHLTELGLSPGRIAGSPRPVALLDLVHGGATFGNLAALLDHWAGEAGVDPGAVRRRLRFVGIIVRGRNSPNTWRWYQQVEWARRFPRRALCSVSVPYGFWTWLGDMQPKVARSNPPPEWDAEPGVPERDAERIGAIRLAYRLNQQGRQDAERRRFAGLLAARPEMSRPWLRRLVLELRGLGPPGAERR